MMPHAISLSHLLGLFRRRKPLVASPGSVATPLGSIGYRVVNKDVSPVEGMKQARTREYAIKPKERKS